MAVPLQKMFCMGHVSRNPLGIPSAIPSRSGPLITLMTFAVIHGRDRFGSGRLPHGFSASRVELHLPPIQSGKLSPPDLTECRGLTKLTDQTANATP